MGPTAGRATMQGTTSHLSRYAVSYLSMMIDLAAPERATAVAAPAPCTAAELLASGRNLDRRGNVGLATDAYAAAIDAARPDEGALLSEALRRLAGLHHRRAEAIAARELALRAVAVAMRAGLPVPAAEALTVLGVFAFEAGDLAEARERFESALELGAADPELVMKVDRNTGLLHAVRAEWPEAIALCQRSAALAELHGNHAAAARAYHDLGLLAARQSRFEEAHRQYRRARGIALREGDTYLEARCLLSQAGVHVALERWDQARDGAERALHLFDRLDALREKGAANRVLGVVFRETRRPALAESRLRSSVEIAVSTRCPLGEAEARRELAELHRWQRRSTDALAELDNASSLFSRLGARADVADIEHRIARVRGV